MADLDERCCRHFTYRDLVECGNTWRRLSEDAPLDNAPCQEATWDAIAYLARELLDPIADRFGRPELTYGFASQALTRNIDARIAPVLDQHAGFEVGRSGRLVCTRGGQAADLFVPNVPSDELAEFILAATPYDRLYYYGADRPIHVSAQPHRTRQVVLMMPKNGRRVPRVVSEIGFRDALAKLRIASGHQGE